jgi:glycosyltransferase involved in cell wall biosynthesis
MKILFITAYFTPCRLGWGYMRLCEQVADGLQARGHQVAILTSSYRDGAEIKSYPVHRLLTIDPDWNIETSAFQQFFVGRKRREKAANQALERLRNSFAPDLIFIWHGHGLPRSLFLQAEQSGRAVYYLANYLPEVADEYLNYWQSRADSKKHVLIKKWTAKLAQRMLVSEGKPASLDFSNVLTVSHFVREHLVAQSLIPDQTQVISNGIDLDLFRPKRNSQVRSGPLRCLTAGRIEAKKGFHTVIAAFAQLATGHDEQIITLTLIGPHEPGDSYYDQIVEQASDSRLSAMIEFREPVDIHNWARLLHDFDVLIIASEWFEPLASVQLEAMASGLIVVGSREGGTTEVIEHGRSGLLFAPGCADDLAQQLETLLRDPDRRIEMARAGTEAVRQAHDIEITVDRIEAYLKGQLPIQQE